ncbi:MAG: hypothetical protein AOA66_0414 [Candidatus Bathyarchaeota archaeon BA2]|nr:MAG: hypothetical protein AOA66_0414 [Candidatus Bathyarchaeota archaeon BA2]
MPRVAIVKGTKTQDMTVKSLKMVNADKALPKKKPILIKPNYINASHPSTGITTDSRVIEGIVKFLKQHNAEEIIIGEGSGFADTLEAFQVAGVDAVAETWNVKLVDLNKDEFVEVSPPNPLALKRVKIAKTAIESTIISVPKLKPHRLATVTLSLKNMMGAVTPKGSIHRPLSEKIVDLASIIKPSVAVIDGIIAGEGHETSGNPVEMNLVIAGTDPVAVDAVGAAVMGIPPGSVKHLRLAEERGLGTCNLNEITVLGEPIEKVKKKFKTSFLSRFLAHLG